MEDQIQLSSNDMANDNVSVTQKNNKELEAVPTVLFARQWHYEKQQHDQKRRKKQENKIEDFSFS